MARLFKYSLFIIALITLTCCQKGPWNKADLRGIASPGIKIHRYELDLFQLDITSLQEEVQKIAPQYSFFLGAGITDTLRYLQLYDYLADPLIRELYDKTVEEYPDMEAMETEMNTAFRYFMYYFPDIPVPEVYTYISGIDFQHPVMYLDTVLIIALDDYLGPDFEAYKKIGLPAYITGRYKRDYITRDCFYEIADAFIPLETASDYLLDHMIREGKRLLFLDAVMPGLADETKAGYSEEQLAWCRQNEAALWKFIIENELLYTTDSQVIQKFMRDGPFTRGFEGSPARLGVWMGWQILHRYMEYNRHASFTEMLMNTDARKILMDSHYKPK